MKILVADDDVLLRELLAEFLHDHGHEVDVVNDGNEALERLRSGAYEVAFLDQAMPGMSGMEVIRAAHESVPQTACVMMTGHTSVTTAVEAIRSGASDFVAKPLETDAIDRVLENVKTATRPPEDGRGRPRGQGPAGPPEVRAAFLTDHAGLLIASRVDPEEGVVDGDLFSATLDVIQNFMRTSFPVLRGRSLSAIQQGDCTLVLEPGDRALLTVLVRGPDTGSLRRRMRKALREFEAQNEGRLEAGLVHTDQVRGADELMSRIMVAGDSESVRPSRAR